MIERMTIEGNSVLSISVNESPLKPHIAYGRPFSRVDSSSVVMDQVQYDLLLSRKRNGGGADRDLCPDATLADIDEANVGRFVAAANERRSTNLPLFADTTTILESLELLSGGVVTKGALLLFGKSPQRFLPQAEFRAAHFRDERREVFLSQRVFGGDLFSQFNAVLDFVKERLSVVDTSIRGDRVRQALPLSVVQELVANALVHRDYRDASPCYFNIEAGTVLEVSNPGLLPAPKITPETIHLPHPSVPVNRRIARAFFLAGLIEQWGEGTRRVWRQVTERGLEPPRWESTRGTVRVVVKLQ